MFGKEGHITLEEYKKILEKLWITNRTETNAVQKAVEFLLWSLVGFDSKVSVVDVHDDYTITSKHDPSRFFLLSEIKTKIDSINNFTKWSPKTKKDIKARYNTAWHEYSARRGLFVSEDKKFNAGPPDLMVVKDYNYENIKNGNGTICFLVETKDYETDVKKIQKKDYEFAQIFSHMTHANNVFLTNGRLWLFYSRDSRDWSKSDERKKKELPDSDVFELWNDNGECDCKAFEALCKRINDLIPKEDSLI